MALSFADWYRAYANQAGMGGAALSDPVLERLNRNATDPGFESAFQRLLTRLGDTGRNANSSRDRSANDARQSASERGLSDETSVETAGTRAGNAALGTGDAVTYKIKMGPDGRAYRQAYLDTSASFGARGWGGSEEKASQWKARQNLNTQRDSLTDNLTSSQNDSLLTQGTNEGNVIDDLAKNVTDYGAWKVEATRTATNPDGGAAGSGTPDPTPAPAPARDPFRGIAVGGVLGTYANNPNTTTLNNAYNAAGGYKVVKRGGKYVVIRTR